MHIDFDLIQFLATARPKWSIVLLGPVRNDKKVKSSVDKLRNFKNIYLFLKPHMGFNIEISFF